MENHDRPAVTRLERAAEEQLEQQERQRARVTVNLRGETWEALQALAYGFTGDDLGTPDKVIAKLIANSDARFVLDGLGCKTLREAKHLVDLGRERLEETERAYHATFGAPRFAMLDGDGTPAQLEREPDGVLESIVAGDIETTETTRHLAQAELDHRRRPR